MEKTFAQELYEIAQAAKTIEKQSREIVSPKSPQKQAEDFLKELKTRLKVAARRKVYFCKVLQLEFSQENYNKLNLLEKMIFDGCKSMGLKTEIQELNGIGMEGGSSDGRWITASWDINKK